jgi:ribosomal protein S18 acetylase RimI-like enzyme
MTADQKLRGRKLTAQQAVKLFQKFYDECSPEECLRAFGWSRPMPQVPPDWTVYEYSDGADVVGFGAIEIDLHGGDDTEAMLVLGVFPACRRRGHWRAIVASLVTRAKRMGADCASQIVYKENVEHYERVMKEAKGEESPWVYAGDVWFPAPGYGYFVHPIT